MRVYANYYQLVNTLVMDQAIPFHEQKKVGAMQAHH
jgi:hypothetical protein